MATEARAWRCEPCEVEWWGTSAVCWVCGERSAAQAPKLYDASGRLVTPA